MSNERQVSVSRVIAAPPQAIFDLLADPAAHHDFDGSDTVQEARTTERLSEGATFGMNMKWGLPYIIKNTVVEFDEPDRIAWRHFGRHVWRYQLDEVDGGTKVTETFDWATALWPKGIELAGYPKRHTESMEKTLERLDELVTSP